jgi:hypothetical protein
MTMTGTIVMITMTRRGTTGSERPAAAAPAAANRTT